MPGETSSPRPAAKPDPGLRASFERFEEQYFLNGRWSDLAKLYRERIASPSLAKDGDERARLWLRLARIQEEKLGDEDAAIAGYRECVGLSSDPRPALQRLRGLYKRRSSWATVLQIAEIEVETARDPLERAQLQREMGDIWEHELGDSEQAEALYACAREQEGETTRSHDPARGGEGERATVARARQHADVGDVESAVAVLRERLAADPQDLDALDLLFSVLEAAGRYAELPAVLDRRAALATDGPTRAELLVRLGALHEHVLDEPDAARVAYERAMGSDPTNPEATLALGRLYRLREAWPALRTLLETRIALAPAEEQVALLCELGELHAGALDDAEAAAAAYRRALAIDPQHARAREALAPLVQGAQTSTSDTLAAPASSAVAALTERLAELEAEGAGHSAPAIRLRLRLAELAAVDGADVARAIALLAPCIDDDEALPQVARALRRLYQRSGDHRALLALAQRAAELCRDPWERAAWYRAAAEAARAAGDGESVALCLERVLEESPGDLEVEHQLLELRRARGEARPLLVLIRRALHRAGPGKQAPLHAEAAALLNDPLGDPDGAFVHWRRAVALDPRDEQLLERALACAHVTGGPLRQLDLLELAAAAASLPRDRARLLARRGALLADALAWTDEGIESWRQSLELDPDQPAIRARLDACAAA